MKAFQTVSAPAKEQLQKKVHTIRNSQPGQFLPSSVKGSQKGLRGSPQRRRNEGDELWKDVGSAVNFNSTIDPTKQKGLAFLQCKELSENFEDDVFPMEQETNKHIVPPLQFETRINQQLSSSSFQITQEKSHKKNAASGNQLHLVKQGNSAQRKENELWIEHCANSLTDRRKEDSASINTNKHMIQQFNTFKSSLQNKKASKIQNYASKINASKQIQDTKKRQSNVSNGSSKVQESTTFSLNIHSHQISLNRQSQEKLNLQRTHQSQRMNPICETSKVTYKIQQEEDEMHQLTIPFGISQVIPKKPAQDQSPSIQFLETPEQARKSDAWENAMGEEPSCITSVDASPIEKNIPLRQQFMPGNSSIDQKITIKKITCQKKIVEVIISYFNFSETLQLESLCKNNKFNPFYKLAPKQLRNFIANSGLTRFERINFWFNKTGLRRTKRELEQKQPNFYQNLAETKSKFLSEIISDAERTFPQMSMFESQARAQKKLIKILNALANYFPDLGYFQGMNFIVASVLLIIQDEQNTFYAMISLFEKYKLKNMYMNNFSQMKVLIFQLESFIQAYIPELCGVLALSTQDQSLITPTRKRQSNIDTSYGDYQPEQVASEYFATQWFLTLFTLDFSIDNTSAILDLFLVEGFKCLLKVALCILSSMYEISIEKRYSQEDFIENLKHFNEVIKLENCKLLNHMQKFKITSKLMRDSERLYYNEQRIDKNQSRDSKINHHKACRSKSLRNRMLMIIKTEKNKHEWIILPNLPSRVNQADDQVEPQIYFKEFQQYLDQNPSNSTSLVLNTDCEEVEGSDEGAINSLLSHKKPYASRMVMSNKKKQYFYESKYSSVKKDGEYNVSKLEENISGEERSIETKVRSYYDQRTQAISKTNLSKGLMEPQEAVQLRNKRDGMSLATKQSSTFGTQFRSKPVEQKLGGIRVSQRPSTSLSIKQEKDAQNQGVQRSPQVELKKKNRLTISKKIPEEQKEFQNNSSPTGQGPKAKHVQVTKKLGQNSNQKTSNGINAEGKKGNFGDFNRFKTKFQDRQEAKSRVQDQLKPELQDEPRNKRKSEKKIRDPPQKIFQPRESKLYKEHKKSQAGLNSDRGTVEEIKNSRLESVASKVSGIQNTLSNLIGAITNQKTVADRVIVRKSLAKSVNQSLENYGDISWKKDSLNFNK